MNTETRHIVDYGEITNMLNGITIKPIDDRENAPDNRLPAFSPINPVSLTTRFVMFKV